MNAGQTLAQMAAELDRQIKTRKDFLAPVKKLNATVIESGTVALTGMDSDAYPLTEWAHGQIASYLNIPKDYADRMRTQIPDLWAASVNSWLDKQDGEKRLVRTLDGKVRAIVSERYRALDNYDLLATVFPVLQESGAQVRSSAVTDTRIYIKATFPQVSGLVPNSPRVGDMVEAGVVISNSEVGNGALRIDLLAYFLYCLNGAIREGSLRKAHLGRGKVAEIEDAREYFSDATQRLDDAAFFSKVKDVTTASANPLLLQQYIDKLGKTTENKIESDDLAAVVQVVTDKYSLSDEIRQRVFRNLIEAGDLSQYGLANAVTLTANKEQDYEVSTILERAGAKVIDLSAADWKNVSLAKAA